MKTTPFWVDDHPRPEGLTGELPTETEYLIIGSGLTGLTTALRLSVGGNDVVVVDSGEIAGGASSINAGMVSPNIRAGVDTIYAIYGPRIGHEIWNSTVAAVDLVRDVASRPGVSAITHDAGTATFGRGSKQLKAFDREVSWYHSKFDVDMKVVDARDIATVVGGNTFNIALLDPKGFGVHPARLSFGLAREVKREGVVLVDRCEATGYETSSDGHTVTTSRGSIRARHVIIATNGHTTPKLSPELSRLIVPTGSYTIVTEPVGAELAAGVLPTGVMANTRSRLPKYIRRTHDDRILIGGQHSLKPGLEPAEAAMSLRTDLIGMWPDLADYEVTHSWGGLLGTTFDLTPHIGRIDGAWYAAGYSGHGVALACQLGHELAGMLLGEDPPSVFSSIPHNGRFYYNGRSAWFLRPVTAVYRAMDRLGV